MKKILLLNFMLLLTLSFSALAQERTVSGTVTSASDGSGLPGVNVILKGTSKGAITDIDGNYKLVVPADGGTLQFSFIGLKPVEVEIGARSVIDVAMDEDVETLSEVVVTGYGAVQKRDLTGSIAQVKGDVIENLPLQSFDRALQGRAAGVLVQSNSGQPGGALSVLIRGQGSLANNTPLYIVDGVQVNTGASAGQGSTNSLGGVNPADIESIEVLKDAASAAIYGAQAANGVVLITTKRGSAGATKLDITYQKGFVQPLELYDVMNAQQFAEIRAEAYENNPSTSRATAIGLYGNPEDPASLTNFDWVDAIFRESANQDILNVRLSGGDDKTNYFMSASLEGTQGQVIKSDYNRQTFRLNLGRQVTEKLKVDATLGVVRINQFGSIANGNFVNGPFQSAFVSQPNSPAFNED
ncbi:MAG: SusC/RagA family TonB-linked outer membrane protein, partial [Bacteroidota bacterium]